MGDDIGRASAEETNYAAGGAPCLVSRVLSVMAHALASQNHPRRILDLYLLYRRALPTCTGLCDPTHGNRCPSVAHAQQIAHKEGTGNGLGKEASEEPRSEFERHARVIEPDDTETTYNISSATTSPTSCRHSTFTPSAEPAHTSTTQSSTTSTDTTSCEHCR